MHLYNRADITGYTGQHTALGQHDTLGQFAGKPEQAYWTGQNTIIHCDNRAGRIDWTEHYTGTS